MTQIWTNSYIAFSSDKLISSIVDISKAIKHGGTAYDVNGLAEIDLSGEKIGGTVDFYPATRPFTYNSSDGLPDQRISDFSFYDKFSAYTYGIHDVYIKFDDLKTLDTRAKVISFFFDGDDIVDGTHRNDVISGYNGNDSIDGYKGNDKLYGGAGDDYLSGWEGNDTLVGGTGNDHLHGGDGKDTFVFNTSLKSANVDSVFDFKHSDDVFQLDHAVFAGLKVGNLSKDAFKVIENIHSTKNVDSNDRILYDKANDDIYFDRDGSGTHYKPVKFVEVIDINDVAKINYTDFHIV